MEMPQSLYTRAELAAAQRTSSLSALVGDKAAEIVDLYMDVSAMAEPFPDFSVIGVYAIDEYYARHDVQKVPPVMPELPGAQTVPASAARIGESFSSFGEGVLAKRSGLPTVLRTSLLWPGGSGPRPPGVDNTSMVASWPPPAVPALASLYKAYTTLYLNLRGLPVDEPRRAGVIVMDPLPDLWWQGTAYVQDDVIVEIAPWGGGGKAQRYADAAALRQSGLLTRSTVDHLMRLIGDLAAGVENGPETCVELEFLINISGRPLIHQRRSLPSGAGIFHTRGEYEGSVVDMRWVRRTELVEARRRLAACSGQMVILPLLDDVLVDAFTVSWWVRKEALPPPCGLVMIAANGSRSGMPIHLPWLLREALPGTLLVSVAQEDANFPAMVKGCRVSSDGVSVSLSWW